MIVRLTQKLGPRIKAGKLTEQPLHADPLLDWSANLFTVGRLPFVIVSHTTTLLSIVFTAKGVTSQQAFQKAASDAVTDYLRHLGYATEAHAVETCREEGPRYAKTLNRSVTGSMNDLILQACSWLEETDLSPASLADRLNDTLLSALSPSKTDRYGRPRDAFRQASAGTRVT